MACTHCVQNIGTISASSNARDLGGLRDLGGFFRS
jgi:hypothetical protein